MAVTSKDIARKLRISQSTVSRALRGDPRVAPDTMARVLEAARQMNYTPNLAARSLITRRTGTVGVVVSDITNPFYPELLDILHNELALAGYRTILFNEQTDASVEQHVGDLVNGRGGRRAPLRLGDARHAAPGHGARDLPVVLVNRYIDVGARGHGRLRQPPRRAARRRGDGRARPPADRADRRAREHDDEPRPRARLPRAAQACGVQFDETLRRVGQFSHHSGYQWCLDLLAAEPRPTAVFAANDVIAFGALDAARRVGVRVPAELSIVGFDDIDMAGWEGFNLTTVRQPLAEMGRAAVEAPDRADRLGRASCPPRRRVFPVGLVHRDTLAAAPAA